MHAAMVSKQSSPVYGVVQSSPDRLRVLNHIVQRVKATYIRVLEIGSYEGSSALNFSNCIGSLNKRGSVFCVDTWKPYLPDDDVAMNPTCTQMQEELGLGTVFDRFKHNIQFAAMNVPISWHKGTMESFCQGFTQQQWFDVIYVDGSHIYEDVKKDLALAWPYLKDGGFMCGDDLEAQLDSFGSGFHAQERVRAVAHREYVEGYHPGVTLAVGERFGHVWCESGTWAVLKVDENRWSI